MAKKTPELDTPFRRGEKVITTEIVSGYPEGTNGKVKLINGVGPWMRYWVRFEDGALLGHVDHNALVRPAQLDQWTERATQQALAASKAAEVGAAAEAAPAVESGLTGDAALIPPLLLERSRAARARLLGA